MQNTNFSLFTSFFFVLFASLNFYVINYILNTSEQEVKYF